MTGLGNQERRGFLVLSRCAIESRPVTLSVCGSMTVVRFAPSPTGRLHVGNARTALVTWLHGRRSGGTCILRFDDTDVIRSREDFVEAIRRDLDWLGLSWDREERQSLRTDRYAEAIEKLKADGRIYACFETEEELSLKRASLLSRGLPPIYDRAALALTDTDKAALIGAGRQPHWRFKLLGEPIEWNDLVRGSTVFNGADLSDPVVIREDGSPLYHLCSVIDDIDMGVTDVVRGEDHVSNTASHIQMFEALGGPVPKFAHLALLASADGQGLSKRGGSMSLGDLREDEGVEPTAVVSLLARIGTSDPVEPLQDLTPLIETFDFSRFGRATARFDINDLLRLNARIVHAMPFEQAQPKLAAAGIPDADAPFWDTVRPNITRVREARDWWDIAKEPIDPIIEEEDFCRTAAKLLPPEPWSAETWGAWTVAVREATGRKGKALFMPLRLALTGQPHGPELRDLLVLIGRGRAFHRLSGEKA
jgi:glutamyl-tRNA synthetase